MIRSLNLDEMFIPTSHPTIGCSMMTFFGGELNIKLNNIDFSNISKVVITNRIKNSDDIMKILIAKNALEIKGVKDFDLIMPYIPYARQDRLCDDGESFTLKVFTNLINSAKFSNVLVLDAHSNVAPALIDNCINFSNINYVRSVYNEIAKKDSNPIVLVSPDSGANKKTNILFETLTSFNDIVKCDKKRNLKNGQLSGFEVFTTDLNGASCLIVDDICSRGGTFMGIAKALKEKNAGKIYLFVTHYENVADEKLLNEAGIDAIFKTNSMNDYKSDFIHNINIRF